MKKQLLNLGEYKRESSKNLIIKHNLRTPSYKSPLNIVKEAKNSLNLFHPNQLQR